MKIRILLLFLVTMCLGWSVQAKSDAMKVTLLSEVKYGPDVRNVVDLWLVDSDKPTPMAIFVHGGGWMAGSKDKLSNEELTQLLSKGISVAAINYRYCSRQKEGALHSIYDVKYALQFIRHHAEEWNIDKTRVGMWGGSAGAGATLWLGFHDELADPDAADPVLRESTRLQAVCGVACQATYDVFKWPEIFGIDPDCKLMKDLHRIWTLNWLGIKSLDEKDSGHGLQMRKELDIISMITPDDPPFYVWNTVSGKMPPEQLGIMIHHPLFAKMLFERGKELNLECYVYTPKAPQYKFNKPLSIADFFNKCLNK